MRSIKLSQKKNWNRLLYNFHCDYIQAPDVTCIYFTVMFLYLRHSGVVSLGKDVACVHLVYHWFFFPFFTMIIGFPVDTQLFFFSFHLFYGRTKQGWADFFFVQRWFMFTTWHQRLCVISHMQCWFRFFGEKSLSHNPSTHELNLRLMNWQLDVKNWIGKIFKILKFWIFINLIVLIFMSVCYRADRRQRWLRVEVTPISTPMEMMLL